MRPIERSPTRLARWASAAAGLLALVSSGFYSWPALVAGTLGLVFLLAGVVRGTNRSVSVGAFGLFAGAVLAGAQGAPVLPVLASVTASVLAWDFGGYAIGLGRQLGPAADTRRLETVHLAASTAVGAVVAAVGFGLYRVGTGDQPVAALVLLVVAAVLLVAALE